jgi:MFS family permease
MQPAQAHDSYAALRIPAFRRYLGANAALFLGLQMQNTAIGWELYERTGSELHLGYINLARFFATASLILFTGHITDVYNRKKILMGAVALSTLAAIGLAWNSAADGPILLAYVFVALTGVSRAFWFPARASFLPRIVPRATFTNAASWNSTTFELTTVSGPPLAAFLISLLGRASVVYLITGAAALVSFGLIATIRYQHDQSAKQPWTVRSVFAGLGYIRRTRVVLAAMTLDMFGVLLGGATTLMPVFAKDILKVGVNGLGWLNAAPAIGAAAMAMIQARRRSFAKPGRALLLAVTGFGLATILFGFSTNFWLSMGALAILGMCDNVSVVIRTTLVQMLTPDEMRGRVSSINGLFITSSNDLGGFESALISKVLSPVASVVSGGIGTIAVVAAVALLWPELRHQGTPEKEPARVSTAAGGADP